MILDYLVFAGTEILNTSRLHAYIDNGMYPYKWEFEDCFCDSLAALLGETYANPQADEAPWANTDDPDSLNFAGILPLSVEGIEEGVTTHTVTNTLRGGAVIGPERCAPREIRVTGILIGKTCCSVSSGLRWLREALRGKDPIDCSTPCGGGTVEFLTCCPTCDPTDTDCYDQYARCLHNTSLVDGPRIIERLGSSCGSCNGCSIMKVEWTMMAGDPFLYGKTFEFVSQESFDLTATCATWSLTEGDATSSACISPDGTCNQHPNGCPVEIPGISPPPPPVPDDPFTEIACGMPLDAAVGQVHRIVRDDSPYYGDLVPIINVYAGEGDLKNFSIYFFENRLEWDCDRFLDAEGRPEDCLACSVISVSYLPQGSVLEINGELGTSQIRTQGNLVSYAAPVLYGKDGRLFSIPSFSCASYCVVAVADGENTDDLAWWNMSLVKRDL